MALQYVNVMHIHYYFAMGGVRMNNQNWTVIRGFCGTEGAEHVPAYGLLCEYSDGVWRWPDVDVDEAVVQLLADRLNVIQPAACHFTDIVLDYIEDRAAGDL